MIHSIVTKLNKSKIFAGVMMVMLNVASKYIHIKLTPAQETYLKTYITRELFVFATCWLGTRDIYVALGITLLFFIVTNYIWHEDSPIGVLTPQDIQEGMTVSPEEITKAVDTLKRAKQQEENDSKTELFNHYYLNPM